MTSKLGVLTFSLILLLLKISLPVFVLTQHGIIIAAIQAELSARKFLVLITAGLPIRYCESLGKGGFRYSLEQGAHYSNAYYRYDNAETAVAHVMLAMNFAIDFPPVSINETLTEVIT